jgi:hypothetical protein
MSKPLALLILAMALSGCSGIPLRSLPKLAALQNELLDANPAEFALAIQMDARIKPPAGTVPELQLAIRPARPGAFEVVDKKLPMRLTVTPAGQMGLAPAGKGRHWLVFSLPPPNPRRNWPASRPISNVSKRRRHTTAAAVCPWASPRKASPPLTPPWPTLIGKAGCEPSCARDSSSYGRGRPGNCGSGRARREQRALIPATA